MPYVFANGIRISYERTGHGERVLLVMGTGARGTVWNAHQVPALSRAGYQPITFDNRGIPPSDVPPGMYSLADMVADTEGLIEALHAGPCRLIGASMGAIIAQELAVSRPDLVECCVLIGTRARADATRRALAESERMMAESRVRLPAAYEAVTSVLQLLSPATLNDDAVISTWLEIFKVAGGVAMVGGQHGVDLVSDRRDALRKITMPCRVIAFADDLVCPPYLSAEVADCIPDCDFVEIPACGHLGYLERPDEVNDAIIGFLDKN